MIRRSDSSGSKSPSISVLMRRRHRAAPRMNLGVIGVGQNTRSLTLRRVNHACRRGNGERQFEYRVHGSTASSVRPNKHLPALGRTARHGFATKQNITKYHVTVLVHGKIHRNQNRTTIALYTRYYTSDWNVSAQYIARACGM